MPRNEYHPDTFEQECICLLYKWLAENGFQNPDLPPIYLSFETPPVFKHISQDWHKIFADDMIWNTLNGNDNALEKLDENQQDVLKRLDEKSLSRNHDERRKILEKIISIDALGVYRSETPEIVLYAQNINTVAQRLYFPAKMLRTVVLVHELGHWISHAVPDRKGQIWNDSYFNFDTQTPEAVEIKEIWAQLFVYWYAKEVKGRERIFRLAFDALNQYQSAKYCAYKKYEETDMTIMLKVLSHFHRQGEALPTEYDTIDSITEYKALVLGARLDIPQNSHIF